MTWGITFRNPRQLDRRPEDGPVSSADMTSLREKDRILMQQWSKYQQRSVVM